MEHHNVGPVIYIRPHTHTQSAFPNDGGKQKLFPREERKPINVQKSNDVEKLN